MKKICMIFILSLLSGFVISCNQAPPPPGAFRLKTRIKFRVFGIPLFAVPAPYQQINLKTNTMPGAPGTMGSRNEYAFGGNYVTTDHVGKFDAMDAVMPATWIVKINPNQPAQYPCSYPATMTFQALDQQTYKYRCNLPILNLTQAIPSSIYVDENGQTGAGNNPVNWTIKSQGLSGESFFSNAQNMKIQYYRLVGIDTEFGDNEEIYELEREMDPKSISPDGTYVDIHYPTFWQNRHYGDFLLNGTTKVYHIVLVEDGVYIAHTRFEIDYPEQNCPPWVRTC